MRRGWLLVLICCIPAPASAELRLGTAKRSLVPPVKTPLAGFSRRKGALAEGMLDPVYVRALAWRDKDTTVALASCDLLIIDETLYQAVKARVDAASPSPIQLIVASTHTHSGPGAYGHKFLEKISMGHFNQQVFDFLAAQISQAVLDAAAQTQPVTVRYGAGETDGLALNRMSTDGPLDAQVRVVRFDSLQGKPAALLVNFSAHPTTLGAWNMRMSADYPGVLMRELDARYPGALTVFVAGAVGDQGPAKHGDRYQATEWLGKQLARRVEAVQTDPAPSASDEVRAWQRVERLPPANITYKGKSFPGWLARTLVDDDATLSLATIGRVAFIGAPCDLTSELGERLRKRAEADGFRPVIVGFADDYIGYCMPRVLYESGSYEASMAFNGPDTGELLVQWLSAMLDEAAR